MKRKELLKAKGEFYPHLKKLGLFGEVELWLRRKAGREIFISVAHVAGGWGTFPATKKELRESLAGIRVALRRLEL